MADPSLTEQTPSPEALEAAHAALLPLRRNPGCAPAYDAALDNIAFALDRFAERRVREERERCLRVLKMNNDNDAHRYYIEHPEFFK